MNNLNTESYIPSEMAKLAQASSVRKANRDLLSALLLSIQAGAFIALGAAFYTYVIQDSSLGIGITSMLGGLAFSLGLILVIIAGADLFTGDTLMIMAYMSRLIKLGQMIKSWIIVFIGNLIGALSIVILVKFSGILNNDYVLNTAKNIYIKKTSLTLLEAFFSGILCNILVCLAIWLCYAGKTVTDKIMAIIFPITAFVAMGFEHSIANMYLLPIGGDNTVAILNNIIPVTIGNMVGGAIFVGVVYWILYLRPNAPKSKSGFES